MPSLHKRLRKIKVPTIYGASDQKVTKFFVFNRAWIANERIVGLTALIVVGLGIIGYATFALSLNSPAGHIDYPAPGQIIGGTGTYIDGWAVAASPVNHVDVVVNGVPARASYGTGAARPDVCAANLYPQSPNCPNVGWQYYFNSTAMPNGTYTLYADIYGSSGGFTETPTQTFTVVNTPPFGYIDSPAPGATVGNTVTPGTTITNVGGWALDNETGISQVTMSIDGIANVYYPIYGASRPDVCAAGAYPNRPNCPNAGFNYSLDTSAIPNGTHTMHITMYDSDGIQKSATMDRTFTVNNTGPPANPTGPGTTPAGGGGGTTPPPAGTVAGGNGYLDGFIDDPKPASQSPPNPYSGRYMTIDGWAIGVTTVVNSVKVYIDGTYIGTAAHYAQGATRPDVCASHPGWVNCPAGNVGWQVVYDTTKLTNGTHTMYAVIGDGAFPSHDFTTAKVSFVTKNATPPPPPATGLPPAPPSGGNTNLPPDVYIGSISPDPLATTDTASGWAIDNMTKAESAIAGVTASIDGNLVGAAQYGLASPSTCVSYPGRVGCPNVGWSIDFDTANLTNGNHTLQITATDATGLTRTASQTFAVNNTTAGCGGSGAQACAGGGLARAYADRNPSNTKQYHFLYVVPDDMANGTLKYDRHLDTNGSIATAVSILQSWLRGQSGGKSYKIDMYAGKPDVTFVQLNRDKAYYDNQSSATGQLIVDLRNDIGSVKGDANLIQPSKKYVIFFEGGSEACGVTNSPGGNTSVVELRGTESKGTVSCNDSTTLDFTPAANASSRGSAMLVAHEMMHAAGAVVGANGKDTCVNQIGAHVSDPKDLMYFGNIALNPTLDIDKNSYWGVNVPSGCNRVDTNPSATPYFQ